MDEKCIGCIEYKRCKDSYTSWFFFLIGLLATIAIRLVTFLININPNYAKAAWYIGITFFILFFVYKFNINRNREKIIIKKNLLQKINNNESLDSQDRETIGAILCALTSKKERINYFFIFTLSIIALIIAIYIDFIKT